MAQNQISFPIRHPIAALLLLAAAAIASESAAHLKARGAPAAVASASQAQGPYPPAAAPLAGDPRRGDD